MKRKAIFLLYRVLQTLASPVILLYFLSRAVRDRRYLSTFRERLGGVPPQWQQTISASIWFHAVSVGEVLAAVPVIQEIKRRNSKVPVFVSVTTLAGRSTADLRLGELADGIFFAPFDFAWAVRKVLRTIRPTVVVILETEIWPNLFREAKRLGCGLAIINGRISDRALPRYRRWSWLFGPVLATCDWILVQTDEMRARFAAAGAPLDILETAGNLKYDFTPIAADENSPAVKFIHAVPGARVWIAASTSTDGMLDEEDAVIAAQHALAGWRLIIAPRKPERFSSVARKLDVSGLRFTRRTDLTDEAADVLLLDSIGELSGLFAHCDAVFMGGTLAEMGGHNILEPAAFGKPVIAGPHLENFRDIAEDFTAAEAVLRIAEGGELARAVIAAAADAELACRGFRAAEAKRGVSARTACAVMDLYDSKYPGSRLPQPLYAIEWIFAQLWKFGSARDRRKKLKSARRLPVPVISIGNITAGGTGKTPVAIAILSKLAAQGLRPGLLTRGHGRRESRPVILLDRTHGYPAEYTGDEPQLYHQTLDIPVGVGPDRFHTGQLLLAAKPMDMLVLDDGFQHLQLARDFNIALIDALNPFGGGHLLPLGRLREPLAGLARADAFVITRSDEVPNAAAIHAVIRTFNSSAPIYCGRTVALEWRTWRGDSVDPDLVRAAQSLAFCGLGNPESFWRTLRRSGVKPLDCQAYDDHHRYTPAEVRRLAQHARDRGARMLLTTAKDAVNLCEGCALLIAPLTVCWLEIGAEIDGMDELVGALRNLAP